MTWLSLLLNASSGEALRVDLAARHPAFCNGRPDRLAVLGAAEEGARLVGCCREAGIEVEAIVDDHPDRQGATLHGVLVQPTAVLDELDRDIPVVVASHRTTGAASRLKSMGFRHVAPFALLQVLAPDRFPPHVFYEGLLEALWNGRHELAVLATRFADEQSRRVLDAVVGYRLTLDPAVLAPEVDGDPYGPSALMGFSDEEVCVDGGAFDGDTARQFIQQVGGRFARLLAFEPDPDTFPRLAAGFATDPRVQPFNYGLSNQRRTLRFDGAGRRGSMLSKDGDIKVEVVGLDEILKGDPATYIKMNIEGAEMDALEGARKTITKWYPKLAIALYHRPDDLYRIPEKVHAIKEGYKFFLRQHDGGIIETVLYALPVS